MRRFHRPAVAILAVVSVSTPVPPSAGTVNDKLDAFSTPGLCRAPPARSTRVDPVAPSMPTDVTDTREASIVPGGEVVLEGTVRAADLAKDEPNMRETAQKFSSRLCPSMQKNISTITLN